MAKSLAFPACLKSHQCRRNAQNIQSVQPRQRFTCHQFVSSLIYAQASSAMRGMCNEMQANIALGIVSQC